MGVWGGEDARQGGDQAGGGELPPYGGVSSEAALTRSGDVLCRPISEPVVTRQLFIASSSERPKTTAQKTVVRTVKDLILENLASGNLPGARAALYS